MRGPEGAAGASLAARAPRGRRRARGALRAVLSLALAVLAASSLAAQSGPDALRLYLDGKYEEARKACLAEIASGPNSIDSYVVLSWSLIALGRYADAENYAQKGYAVRKDPRLTEILGETAYFLGRNDAALRNFQDYVGTVPEGGRVGMAYYYMGEIYLRLGRFGHADIAFSAALQFTPGSAKWWTRLGYARERYGDAVHALEAYKKALSIDPHIQDAADGADRMADKLR
jgi:tetratricopeptide (TPR) repeat protein